MKLLEYCEINETIKGKEQIPQLNFAKVPDEKFAFGIDKSKIPTVNEVIKDIENCCYKINAHEFLSDIFEMMAIAISNKFDLKKYEAREQTYLTLINKYDKNIQQEIVNISSKIHLILTNQIHIGFFDYLGEIYMKSKTSNNRSGQFFTPYSVSKATAELAISRCDIEQFIKQDKIITLNEPTCGSGGMILGTADVLYNKHRFNITRNMFVVCGDIDKRCVMMTYLQLGLAGIPAIIYHQDALTLETWDVWKTPAYIMQYSRFAKYERGVVNAER